MNKIVLTADEINVIQKQLNGEIEIFTATDEEQALLTGVIDKAEALMDELDAYDELDGDLIDWYYKKYQAQQTAE
nr:MAG TPA: hypothetical protein [Caudoviricetes sp.]